jgi:hypothetical protein
MIAPLKETHEPPTASDRSLVEARRAVASVFFDPSSMAAGRPRVSPWRAWLFIGSIALAATAFLSFLGGWWKIRHY